MINTILKNTTTQTLLRDALLRHADFHVGIKATKKVVPNLNISFDCASGVEKFFINLNRRGVTVKAEKHTYLANKLRLKVGNNTDVWHIDANGDFKWDVEYAVDPRPRKGIAHVERWDITHSPGIRVFYQDALENDWAKKNMGMTLTKYLAVNSRPAKVIGSYAVYADKKHHAVRPDGSTIANYATGKLAHIYRPLCIDAAGKKVWARLNITGNTLSIEIPASYLDTAVYPVTLDPTIGNTAEPATVNTTTDGVRASRFTSGVAGSADTIHCFGDGHGGTFNAIGGVYADNAGTATSQSKLSSAEPILVFGATGTPHWLSGAITWASIAASTDYWISFNCADVTMHYDTISPINDMEYYTRVYDGTLDDPFSASPSTLPWAMAIYITYTASGGGGINLLNIERGLMRGANRGVMRGV